MARPEPPRLPPTAALPYDALLLVSFGGPEGPDDVTPFLENVTAGKNVPPERIAEVAEHYHVFDGVSPLNAQNRALLVALVQEFNAHGLALPVYWGNRNWHPLLPEVIEQMAEDGIGRVLAFVTSAFGSYSGCRQYQEDIAHARQAVGPQAPTVDKLRLFYNHPGFIEAMADRVWDAFEELPAERRDAARLVFTAHSLPAAMAQYAPHDGQYAEACRLVCERLGRTAWERAYQSRSGRPDQPWLGPDLAEVLRRIAAEGAGDVVLAPIGFLSEHIEVIYDLDIEARALCEELHLNMIRSGVVGCHPRFVRMIRELVEERLHENPTRLALGSLGPWPDQCPDDCCGGKRD
jgi:protoporphyrin/coproporphyrin ferrochelatase